MNYGRQTIRISSQRRIRGGARGELMSYKVYVLALATFAILLAGCVQQPPPSPSPTPAPEVEETTAAATPTGGQVPALQVRTKELPQWEAPGAATYKLDVVGGVPPYSFSLAAGSQLPSEFTLGPDGTIGGLVRLPPGTSKSESPPFTILVKDSVGTGVQATFTIRIIEANTLQIITTPATCVVNQECDVQIATAEGGNPPYSFQSDSFAEGPPPFGTIVDLNGHLTGKPSREGEYVVGVCVKDTISNQRCGKATLTVQKGIQLTGTWSGNYGETENSDYCIMSNSGVLTFSVTETDGAFSGTVDDSGVSSSASPATSGASCEGGSFHLSGTVSGTIAGDTITGTMHLTGPDSQYELPFTATLTPDTMTGSYSGTGTFTGGGSSRLSGSFKLDKKS